MDDHLSTIDIGNGRSVHISTLSRQTIIDAAAEHMGFGGFFVYETDSSGNGGGIHILCKTCSFEAALRVAEIWEQRSDQG